MQEGKLILIPTPIGNLEDITLRGLRMLKEADAILAEDTRQTVKLLNHYEISKPLWSYHAHNEHKQVAHLIEEMQGGKVLGMVSDAGTPAISDPGFLLVRECLKAGISVECLPGATAFVPALVKSGLPSDAFIFLGFLPEKKGRQTAFKALVDIETTMIFYESPHRLLKTLTQFGEYLGLERQASVSRELTKMFEETINGSIAELIHHFSNHPIKGEFVLVVEGKK
ncbi:MAG: 16S rRNA (cytidine(1402)-2'-O)-methyltransferase [Bacteroidia bacterium]|nr:16S rRNA (cytidine(1402)-2'-O)-methyltransferase [Bacteroidia bacterium]MCF8447555.1 16S rRNA (cytidine(1402)-2'-O)-methyltransferase [Bacteroidia bacterium]